MPAPGHTPGLNGREVVLPLVFCHLQLNLILIDITIKHLPESQLGYKTGRDAKP